MINLGQTSKVAVYSKKVGMNLTHRELVDLTARFNPQAALNIANNLANALVLVDPERNRKSLEDMARIVDMLLTKAMPNEATTYAMENLSDKDDSEGPIQTKVHV